ncbi:MAG: hypothetical protein JXB50_16465 [Spirochaetes bacterium]|nr:hypothetical protein [Spirochaetota bacterium]
MKKKAVFLFISLLFIIKLYPDQTDDFIKSKISKTNIKLGEKIKLTVTITDEKFKESKVFWNNLTFSNNKAEVLSYKDSYNNKTLSLEIIFTFYEAGNYKDFSLTIPVSSKDEELFNLITERYTIEVASPLSLEEIETIKKIKDPSKIELKKEKPQAKMPFRFSFYIKVILIILLIVLIGLLTYYFIYKLIFKSKEKHSQNNLSPYENFLVKIEKLNFSINDDRKKVEIKLSQMSEILKELIFMEFSFNAPSETTNELILTLRNIYFDQNLIVRIKDILEETDLIKFAKAKYEIENLENKKETLKKLGTEIHQYKLVQINKQENLNEQN